MKKHLLMIMFISIMWVENGNALSVIDHSNLAQNLATAREAVLQTQNQLQMITNQINQYKRMLQDAMNPIAWAWGDIKGTLDQLKNTLSSLKTISNTAGNIDQYLSQFGTYDKYQCGTNYGSDNSTALYAGDLAGGQFQKQSADDLLNLVKEQQEALESYSDNLEELKKNASKAEGQQEAFQALNQFSSMQIELLAQIQTLLLAQNTMMAAQVETELNREAQQRTGTAIRMGETDRSRAESSRGGNSYRQF